MYIMFLASARMRASEAGLLLPEDVTNKIRHARSSVNKVNRQNPRRAIS